ncbi:MAG: hypothetical protein QG657_583 [Acidobacteriota bacterium]|nr:hypothetical protein [Acidobacteriota bacterium]
MLTGEADPGSELKKANISFSIPDEKWQKTGNTLELNVYLYDIRENQELRNNEPEVVRTPDGKITQKMHPRRIDCSYFITAWNKAPVSGGEDKEFQEHRLLTQALYVLMRNPFIPPVYLKGALKSHEDGIPVLAAQKSHLNDPMDFWNTLGAPVKPGVDCIVTLPLDLKKAVTGAMVISKVTEYRQEEDPEIQRKVVQVGGRIMDSADPSKGIAGVTVIIEELKLSDVTDADGYYTFDNLSPGKYTFKVIRESVEVKKVKLDVPNVDNKNYDFKLTI